MVAIHPSTNGFAEHIAQSSTMFYEYVGEGA